MELFPVRSTPSCIKQVKSLMGTKRSSTISQSPTENWTDDLPVCKLSGVGFLTNQRYREDGGRREEHEFEDRSFHFNVDDTYLYGVFDGHDGTRASDFTVQRLPAELLLGQLTASMNDDQIKIAIRQAFIAVEKGFFQSLDDALAEKTELQLQMPEGLSSYEAYQNFPEQVTRIQALQDEISGGTTAVLALIFQKKLFVANVGDSRALLCRETPDGNLSVQQLSVDHVTNNKEELTRLANLGLDIQQIVRNHRIGNQENTRSIGDYGVKGGYKDFDILSVASGEPVIAEPHIYGGIPINETFYALVLMSDGVYRSIEEVADIETDSNVEVVSLVVEELHNQNNLTGVAQAVMDKIGRRHHDTYMTQLSKCQKRDDMTLLIRIFKEEIANSLKSPRASGRQAMSGMPPVSPGVLPVSVPYNPANTISGNAPSLYIPQGIQPKEQSQSVSSPSSTTSTPTNAAPPLLTVSSSRSETQSSASSTNQSSPTMSILGPGAFGKQETTPGGVEVGQTEGDGKKHGEDVRVEPYVNFADFFRQVAEFGEDHVYGWDKNTAETAA
ncbi:TGF-beta-activated kinase 1 and MAP3K7-binding protein 1-like isoform X2 [Montipora foliosa]|uniref:TGF-beta-activated kinase 1 and MAP3K7-binding protein 1-like isoform X2 n=1 Tax=Montipora foliosa TaxID=591990 RepID=UPI0035F11890